jgi:hypothetical protein
LDAFRVWSYLGTGFNRDGAEAGKHGKNRKLKEKKTPYCMHSGFGHISVGRGIRDEVKFGKQGKYRNLGLSYRTPMEVFRVWLYLGTGVNRDGAEAGKHGKNRKLGKK